MTVTGMRKLNHRFWLRTQEAFELYVLLNLSKLTHLGMLL